MYIFTRNSLLDRNSREIFMQIQKERMRIAAVGLFEAGDREKRGLEAN